MVKKIIKKITQTSVPVSNEPKMDYSGIKEILEREIESLNSNSKDIENILQKLSEQELTDKQKQTISKSFEETDRLAKKFKKENSR